MLVTAEGANTSITNAYCGCKDGNGGGQLRRFKDMSAPILIGIIFINSYIGLTAYAHYYLSIGRIKFIVIHSTYRLFNLIQFNSIKKLDYTPYVARLFVGVGYTH